MEEVLVAVLKQPRDLGFARRGRWYRIPAAAAPKRAFRWLAFYQGEAFGREQGRIRWYARVTGRAVRLRRQLLPEPHPEGEKKYLRLRLAPLRRLARAVVNRPPRRVAFGFTTLARLRSARDILQLFEVPPIEALMQRALRRAGLRTVREHTFRAGRRRFRLDFALACRRGRVGVECDGAGSHSSAAQKRRDRLRDLALERRGWRVLRFSEASILERRAECVRRVRAAVRRLGGPAEDRL